jgi:hypothetical protein
LNAKDLKGKNHNQVKLKNTQALTSSALPTIKKFNNQPKKIRGIPVTVTVSGDWANGPDYFFMTRK